MGNPAPRSISVVVPTYNRADLIGATIDRILAQSRAPDEVIVVDDGSSDDTATVLGAYGSRVRVIRVLNGGDLVARNIGLRAASGSLVAFCDSDDLWEPGFLSSMAAIWDHEPGLMTAYGNFRLVRDGLWQDRTKFDDAPSGFWDDMRPAGAETAIFQRPILDRLVRFQPFFPSAMMVDRSRFIAAGGWDESVSRIIGCDFATALRAAEVPIGILRTPLVGIRKHGGNISADVQKMNLGDVHILELMLKTRPALVPFQPVVTSSIADRRSEAADTAFDRRDFASVRSIQRMLPASHRPLKRRLKNWISCLPSPLARAAATLVAR